MRTRLIGGMALVGVVGAMGSLSTAWACTGQPQVFSVSPLTAPVGAQVTMRGEAVAATTPVELRWNGVAGPKLAEVTADSRASFELAFTVPDVAPGVYSLAVVTGQGTAVAVGRTTVEVSGAGASPAPALAGTGFASATDAVGLNSLGSSSSTAMLTGVGLLAFGSVALLGGVAVATQRRRRAPALTSSGR